MPLIESVMATVGRMFFFFRFSVCALREERAKFRIVRLFLVFFFCQVIDALALVMRSC